MHWVNGYTVLVGDMLLIFLFCQNSHDILKIIYDVAVWMPHSYEVIICTKKKKDGVTVNWRLNNSILLFFIVSWNFLYY
jgi:hypothetical protein